MKTKIRKFLIGLVLTAFTVTALASRANAPLAESNSVAVYTAMQVLLVARHATSVTMSLCEELKTDRDAKRISTKHKNLMAFSVAYGAWSVVMDFADTNAKWLRGFKDDKDDEYYEVSMEVMDSVRKLAKSITSTNADVDDILEALSSADRKIDQLLKRLDRYIPSPSGRRSSKDL
jgi:peptidoglycan hydrolase CwlO-like protein